MASTPLFYDRVQETSTTTGTGTYTLAGAVTGFQTFAAVGNSNSCYYCAQEVDGDGNPSGGWEVGIGTYTTTGTTLSRDQVLYSSNSDAAVSWTAGTRRIFLVSPSTIATPELECNGRLTTESGAPISTSDRSSQGTIYFTPYVGNVIALWNGNGWTRYRFAELSLALSSLTSGLNYDVFVDWNAGSPQLVLVAWTNDTTRATALTTQDGVYVLTGSLDHRYVGTIRTTGTATTEDSATKRFVWNMYNRTARRLQKADSTSHSYSTATWRAWNNDSANRVEFVTGEHTSTVMVGRFAWTAGSYAQNGLGLDTTTNVTSGTIYLTSSDAFVSDAAAFDITVGYHYVSFNENATSGTSKTFAVGRVEGAWMC